MNRLRAYLGTMLNDAGDDLEIHPLVAMNPMAREHVPRLIDDYLTLAAFSLLASVPGEMPRDRLAVSRQASKSEFSRRLDWGHCHPLHGPIPTR